MLVYIAFEIRLTALYMELPGQRPVGSSRIPELRIYSPLTT